MVKIEARKGKKNVMVMHSQRSSNFDLHPPGFGYTSNRGVGRTVRFTSKLSILEKQAECNMESATLCTLDPMSRSPAEHLGGLRRKKKGQRTPPRWFKTNKKAVCKWFLGLSRCGFLGEPAPGNSTASLQRSLFYSPQKSLAIVLEAEHDHDDDSRLSRVPRNP